MQIKLAHTPYIAHKIAIDLLNSKIVTILKGIEPICEIAEEILNGDIAKERALEERVKDILSEQEDNIEFMQVDRKSMFWLIKKKLAPEFGVMTSYEDRYSDISHRILEALWKKSLIDYTVSENRLKNIIYNSIRDYIKSYEKIEDEVFEKIDNYKRKLIPGTEEYEMVFEKLYLDELKKRGLY